ncbi:MAG: YceI family protein [Bdellovibrionota bacterium]
MRIQVDQFGTGIGMRDEHLKTRYLEVAQFPESTLEFKDAPLTDQETTFTAKLTLHGKTKEVPVKGSLKSDGAQLTGSGSFTISISDFEIPNPGYKSVSMAETVSIEAQFTASKQLPALNQNEGTK